MIWYYPNRPMLIPPDPVNPMNPSPDYINEIDASREYVAEKKFNGDNTLIHTDEMKWWNRKHELCRYNPPEPMREELARWKEVGGNAIINAELMHYHTTTVKDVLHVHCIMAWKGEYLYGKTWGDSRAILDRCIDQGLSGEYIQISPVWKSGFWELYKEADGKIIEGIILKNPKGKLVFVSAHEPKDVAWMKKIRVPSKKYQF